jgi:RimJ/RimL family protein N-acetyltransferase
MSVGATIHFDLQPRLAGELVTLRPLSPQDFDELYAVASDPLIWEQHPARNRHERRVFEQFFRDALDEVHRRGGAFAVIDNATGRIIGSTRFHGHDPAQSEVEIGWTFLARSHWGGRYNRDMKRLLVDHALKSVERVIFLVGEHNVRSQTAMERIGGVRSGFVEQVDFGGPIARSVKYVLSRREWRDAPLGRRSPE